MAKKIVSLISILLVASLMLTSCNDSASKIDPSVIAGLDADYYIDYKGGTIPIGDLPIGARVVDPSWEWEYRLGVNYSDIDTEREPTPAGEVKPVTWIIVAKDHYEGIEPHVTLLSEDLIGLHIFDNSTARDHKFALWGYNHWGESGTANASHGLRPWLNSTGIHAGEGFYRAFSESFKQIVLTTNVPNREWINGEPYSTEDRVFIPSITELGDTEHNDTYRIGFGYPYFANASDKERMTVMVGDGWREVVEKNTPGFLDDWGVIGNNWLYWTRSPDSGYGEIVRLVDSDGGFYYGRAYGSDGGVRPALNLKSGIVVSEIKD